MRTATAIDAAAYTQAFETASNHGYPVIDAFEARAEVALDRYRLEMAARVLACPVKAHPPNWQHGRVLYAATRQRLRTLGDTPDPVRLLDVGTAKGFSALCLHWALQDSRRPGQVWSLDVIDPAARVLRNTIAEVDGPRTLAEMLAPWPEASAITFVQSDARTWLTAHPERVQVAFLDGKHTYDAVSWETCLLAARQESGDVIVLDDLQIPGIARAVAELRDYDVERIWALKARGYAIARKR